MAIVQYGWTDDDEKDCEGKHKYSKNEAERMKERVGQDKDKSMRIYECNKCHYWHLTKKNPRM